MQTKKSKLGYTIVVMLFTFCIYGGFYEWGIAAAALLIIAGIICSNQKYSFQVPLFPLIILCIAILTTIWSIDYTENLLGIIRISAVVWWIIYCSALNKREKKIAIASIPYMGIAMTICGFFTLLFDSIYPLFWSAQRFGGFFQYANTCALFLLIGIIVLAEQMQAQLAKGKNWYRYIGFVILLVGLLATGSRSIMILFLLWGLTKGKKAAAGILLLGAGAYCYLLITGNQQNIARIFTLLTSNSTIYGRLLYYLDALDIIKAHPFGLGYMGYYYIQHSVQRGVYTVRFVHNDFLQAGLDYGVAVMLIFTVYLIGQICKGKQTRLQKELLLIIGIASAADFHLQYFIIEIIGALCLDLDYGIKWINKEVFLSKILKFALGVAASVYLLAAVPLLLDYLGDSYLALQCFPHYTRALEHELAAAQEPHVAVYYADKILTHNQYVAAAWDAKAYDAAEAGDFQNAICYKDNVIELERYNVEEYKRYDMMLKDMIMQSEELDYITKKRVELPKQLEILKEQTRDIAYKIRDKPVFAW